MEDLHRHTCVEKDGAKIDLIAQSLQRLASLNQSRQVAKSTRRHGGKPGVGVSPGPSLRQVFLGYRKQEYCRGIDEFAL